MFKLSLRGKLVVTFVLAAVIPAIVMAGISHHISSSAQKELMDNSLRTNKSGVDRMVSQARDAIMSVGEIVAKDANIIKAVNDRDQEYLKAYSKNLLANNAKISDYFTFVDNKGIVLARGHRDETGDSMAANPAVKAALDG